MKRSAVLIVAVIAISGAARANVSLIAMHDLTGPDTVAAGLVVESTLPASLYQGASERADSAGQIFLERENMLLTEDLGVVGGTILAGTRVNSYIVHFDPKGSSSSPVWEISGSITFDEAVLGLIYATDADYSSSANPLDVSDDIVGLGSSYYDPLTLHRKLETGNNVWIDTAGIANTVNLNLFTNSSMDEVRIITQGVAVPAPGAFMLGLLGTGIVGYVRRRRDL